MTSPSDTIATIGYGAGVVGMGGAVFSFLRFSNYKETVQLQNDNMKALKDRVDILNADLVASGAERAKLTQSITVLERDVKTYRDLQLDKIATSLDSLSKSNTAILKTLNNSAHIRANETAATSLIIKNGDSEITEDNTRAVKNNTVAVDKNTKK